MSSTIVDIPKVTQMLDAGWRVKLFKNDLGSYTAHAEHDRLDIWARAKSLVLRQMVKNGMTPEDAEDLNNHDFDIPREIDTDDFTPEQALTRLAYKVHGEIL